MSVLATEDKYLRGEFNPNEFKERDVKDRKINNRDAAGMTSGVYPPMFHYLRKYGIYVFRFFKEC